MIAVRSWSPHPTAIVLWRCARFNSGLRSPRALNFGQRYAAESITAVQSYALNPTTVISQSCTPFNTRPSYPRACLPSFSAADLRPIDGPDLSMHGLPFHGLPPHPVLPRHCHKYPPYIFLVHYINWFIYVFFIHFSSLFSSCSANHIPE